jgi:hypothetical protein
MTAGRIAVTGQMSGPHVQRVQSVSDAYEGPPTVVSNSGLPFETGTELSTGLRRRSVVGDAALPSNSGLSFESIANPPRKVSGAAAALSGEGELAAEATIRPGRVTIVPTPYPSDPAAPLVVSGYVFIDMRSAEFGELNAKLDQLIRLLNQNQSNLIAGETRDQLIAEIQAGQRILTAPKPDRNLIEALLMHPLTWIAGAAGAGIIGDHANEALNLLLRMLETNIPL